MSKSMQTACKGMQKQAKACEKHVKSMQKHVFACKSMRKACKRMLEHARSMPKHTSSLQKACKRMQKACMWKACQHIQNVSLGYHTKGMQRHVKSLPKHTKAWGQLAHACRSGKATVQAWWNQCKISCSNQNRTDTAWTAWHAVADSVGGGVSSD